MAVLYFHMRQLVRVLGQKIDAAVPQIQQQRHGVVIQAAFSSCERVVRVALAEDDARDQLGEGGAEEAHALPRNQKQKLIPDRTIFQYDGYGAVGFSGRCIIEYEICA